jgi:hypothetical protein
VFWGIYFLLVTKRRISTARLKLDDHRPTWWVVRGYQKKNLDREGWMSQD